ncbi:hypothetical protein HPB51_006353 [Rhipicephalus microplus]|uniref:Uncharacterized protein n=1 Tax=Rhipicephalus microplus TaxID=6941 RepID=A0A9J6DLT9_RHIMP|nr:hypothetical protein HPB51_006353 [Rhipicephalus microplus]
MAIWRTLAAAVLHRSAAALLSSAEQCKRTIARFSYNASRFLSLSPIYTTVRKTKKAMSAREGRFTVDAGCPERLLNYRGAFLLTEPFRTALIERVEGLISDVIRPRCRLAVETSEFLYYFFHSEVGIELRARYSVRSDFNSAQFSIIQDACREFSFLRGTDDRPLASTAAAASPLRGAVNSPPRDAEEGEEVECKEVHCPGWRTPSSTLAHSRWRGATRAGGLLRFRVSRRSLAPEFVVCYCHACCRALPATPLHNCRSVRATERSTTPGALQRGSGKKKKTERSDKKKERPACVPFRLASPFERTSSSEEVPFPALSQCSGVVCCGPQTWFLRPRCPEYRPRREGLPPCMAGECPSALFLAPPKSPPPPSITSLVARTALPPGRLAKSSVVACVRSSGAAACAPCLRPRGSRQRHAVHRAVVSRDPSTDPGSCPNAAGGSPIGVLSYYCWRCVSNNAMPIIVPRDTIRVRPVNRLANVSPRSSSAE